jgi:DNA-binding transcriptional regulator YiaG
MCFFLHDTPKPETLGQIEERKYVRNCCMSTVMENTISPIKKLRQDIHVTRSIFCRLLPVSERLLADLEANKRAPGMAVQRELNELSRLIDALKKIVDPAYLADWLSTPNDAFSGLKPIEVIERGEADRIWRMVYAIESGQPA